MSATPTSGQAPLNVKFSASDGGGASSDPDGDTLDYSWDFGDGSTATGASAQRTYTTPGVYTATLTVSDGRGLSSSKSIQIAPGGDPPSVSIDAPNAGASYRDGDVVQLRGSATDPQDGALHGASLQWLVRLHHASHIHPLSGLSGEATSFAAVRDHDADSHYELTLIATDSDGLTASKSIEIFPQTVPLTLESVPSGAPVSYGGRAFLAPTTLSTAIGYDTTASAAERFSDADGRRFQFESWSDGGTLVHSLRVPDYRCTLRATYLEDFAALGTASTSGIEGAGFEPANALDDSSLTRWSSSVTDTPWWQVDLGTARDVSRVEVDWEADYAASYTILTSLDGVSFIPAATGTASAAGTEATSFPARSARYVRVQATAKANPAWGVSAYDVRVLGAVAGAGSPPACAPEIGPAPRNAPLPPAGPPQPPAGDDTTPRKPKDVIRPQLRAPAIAKRNGKRVLSVRVSERATLKVGLAKRVRGHWRSIKASTHKVGSGTARIALPRSLKSGLYRVTVSATDLAGNKTKKPLALRFRVSG
jgi:hypothetical protein